MESRRFISNILPRVQEADRNSLSGYEHLPLLTLEESTENLLNRVPGVMGYVSIAKQKCNRDLPLLTWDESAAIYLYTMPISFFSTLNIALRDPNRQSHHPWIPFLKLLITALERLPSAKATIWRGISYDATSDFVDNSIYTWWSVTSCTTNVNRVQAYLGESGTLFAIETAHGKDISMLSAVPDECEVVLMPATRVRARHQPLNIIDRFFVIHLEEISAQNQSNHIFEQIKQEYQRNSRIELFINPAISFPLEQCYINLAIVENREQQAKEKQLQHAQYSTSVIGAYEEIYAAKTPVDVRDIFKPCNTREKQVLVFGRAGIGKSTFCRHVAYQWAIGSYWAQYELLALIPLRQLTADRYPSGREYSLIDVIKRELFPLDLTPKEDEELTQHFDAKKTLWILDGYDEIVQTTPSHLQTLLAKLCKTPHHIITSRPYLNTLSYQVQMEIIGFTDDNIATYVHNFFHQMQNEIEDASVKNDRLIKFLESNRSIWGVAHVPVNLELICSLWSDQDWSETQQLTITRLYSMMTEWLCRRYLRAQGVAIQQLSTSDVYEKCEEELRFVETLAFHAMKSNTILLRPALLKTAMEATKMSRQKYSNTLNMGILKSVSKQGVSTQVETNKDHYFLHLSFQEYFAARYLSDALRTSQSEESLEFIRQQKYNQRYTFLLSFTAGLLSENGNESCLDLFWDTVLGSPVDLIGVRHMQLAITCMEELNDTSIFSRRLALLEWIVNCLRRSFAVYSNGLRYHILQPLQRAQKVACDSVLTNFFIDCWQHGSVKMKSKISSFAGLMYTNYVPDALIAFMISQLDDENVQMKLVACEAIGRIGEKAATEELISKLADALEHQNETVREHASHALQTIGGKAATNEVITRLMNLIEGPSEKVRSMVCAALTSMIRNASTDEVILKLLSALEDERESVRGCVCFILAWIDKKAVTNEVVDKLISALDDQSETVKDHACRALGEIGSKVATDQIINKLISSLESACPSLRRSASSALEHIGKKEATYELISKLVGALEHEVEWVRQNACIVLKEIGEKAATTEVISKLVSLLEGESESVRESAYDALGEMGEKAVTNELINKVVNNLQDQNVRIRRSACLVLGKLCQKVVTKEAIDSLVKALEHQDEFVRTDACIALGNLGTKAAMDNVITKLTYVLEDHGSDTTWYACYALGHIGKKAATNEAMNKILNMVQSGKLHFTERAEILEYILRSPEVIKHHNPMIIKQILQKFGTAWSYGKISERDFIKIFCETRNLDWLSIVIEVAMINGSAVVAADNKLKIYGDLEPYELLIENDELYNHLVVAFIEESERLHLSL